MDIQQFRNCLILCISLVSSTSEAYTTFVVGDDLGWITPSDGKINYTTWASNKTFSLGDSLDFHYDSTHTVVQTDLLKTFEDCDSTSEDNSLQIWSSPGSTGATVELRKTGDTYFFDSAFDGEHCKQGQKFHIFVNYGAGLPLAPAIAPSSGDDDETGNNGMPGFNNAAPPPPPPLEQENSRSRTSFSFACVWMIVMLLLHC